MISLFIPPIISEIGHLKDLADIFFNGLDYFRGMKLEERNKIATLFQNLSDVLKNVAIAIEHNNDAEMAGACGKLNTFASQIRSNMDLQNRLANLSRANPGEIADKIYTYRNIEHSVSNGDIARLDPERRKKLIRDYSYVSGEFEALADIVRAL
jgi:hypothetical protein